MSATTKRAAMIVDDVWFAFQDFIVAVNVWNEAEQKRFKLRVAAAVGYHLNEIAHDVEIAIKDMKA